MQEKIQKLRELKILFVEDESELLTIISTTLSKLSANFETAQNGQEALNILENSNDFQLIVTDINMPVMDGLELIENVRKTMPDIPVVIMSAHTEKEYLNRANELGVDHYLLKPFDFLKFLDLISSLEIEK